MKMIFLQSKARILAVAFSLVASVQAAYHMTTRSTRPTLSLQRMMYPSYNRPSFLARDLAQVMRGFDQMFDSMAMMNRFDDMFYQPFPLVTRQLMNRQSIPDVLRVPYEFAQDDKQAQIKISLPGIEASDINLQVDQDKHLLTITGKTKREEENGFQSTTSFERSFTLTPDIDASNISAQLENDVLLITAPKLDSPKETVRKIDVVDLGKRDDESHKATTQVLPTEEAKAEAEEAVIDLDVQE
jgi:HSP20 family molecular chaperone IbpA